MTAAELIVITLVLYLFYRLLRPVQHRLEIWLLKKLKRGGKNAPIIEIKDYEKKN
jgi:hypothetical protein